MSKAFKPFNQSAGTSSERTNNLRRQTMYNAIVSSQDANQLSEYQSTNRNFSVKSCGSVLHSSGKPASQLSQVSSYRTYMDLAIGKRIVNPVINGQEALSMQSNMGAFYRLNTNPNATVSTTQADNGSAPLPTVQGTEINGTKINQQSSSSTPIAGVGRITLPNSAQDDVPVDYNQFVAGNANGASVYDNYPGYVVDPFSIRTTKCNIERASNPETRKIKPNISIDARWLESYWGAVAGQPLTGFSFPSQVVFGTQNTLYNDHINSYKVAPMTQVSDMNGIAFQDFSGVAFQNASSRYCTDSVDTNDT